MLRYRVSLCLPLLSSCIIIVLLLTSHIIVQVIGCPYLASKGNQQQFSDSDNTFHSADHISRILKARKDSPTLISPPTSPFCIKTNGSLFPSYTDFDITFNSIKKDFYNQLPPADDEFELCDALAQSLRLSFHDAGEADVTSTDTLGPDGCISDSSDSNGLLEPTSYVTTLLEPIWQKYCDKISRADFWALIGKLATEYSEPTKFIKIPYQYGRIDNRDCSAGSGRLPNAQSGLSEVSRVFVKQMGLTMNDGVTLLGAHTLGHVNINQSGYGVPLSNPRNIKDNAFTLTPLTFDRTYYGALLAVNWTAGFPPTMTDPSLNIWLDPSGGTIMLNVDLALAFDITLDENDVAINKVSSIDFDEVGTSNAQICSGFNPDRRQGCVNPSTNPISTFELVLEYTVSNKFFLLRFAEAYVKMTSVGYGTKLPALIPFVEVEEDNA